MEPPTASSIIDYLKTWPIYALPHHWLTGFIHRAARCEWPAFKNALIERFIRLYRVDMDLAEVRDPHAFPHFNAFFTRALRPDARPLELGAGAILSPVDGKVSECGRIEAGRILQAKGHRYRLNDLLADDRDMTRMFEGGAFATLYLSPRDYHRIHMPLTGRLRKQVYVPGRLFPVNTPSTRVVPSLFARNERVIALFETKAGPLAMILVGALFVGSMETVWAGTITPTNHRYIQVRDYSAELVPVVLKQGAEMGRFNMGSTVILLFGAGRATWSTGLCADAPVKMGQRVGSVQPLE
jgi:phosphatidylserine decarboxylase